MTPLSDLAHRYRDAAPAGLWLLVTGVAALLLLTATVPYTAAVYDVPVLLAFAAGTAQCLALPLALVQPRVATVLQFAAASVIALSGPVVPGELWPLPVTGIVALSAHVAITGLRERWSRAVLTWWASALLCIALVLVDPRGRGVEFASTTLILYTSNSVLVLAASIAYRQRGRVRQQLREARRDVQLEQSRRALVEERAGIARELHDVVAHSMSVIHMQAATAPYRRSDLDPATREEMAQIARAAKDAIGEMRQILTVLRDDRGASTEPAPDLSRLPALADSAARAGSRTLLDLSPALAGRQVPPGVAVAAYRIAQEAISNVIRHSPGAVATIQVDIDDAAESLVVTITNEAPANHPATEVTEDGGGRTRLGLLGMRERVQLLGGSLTHGPQPDGGFAVAARLPLPQEAESAVTSTRGSDG